MDISVQFVEPPKKVWGLPHRLMPATFNLSASHALSLLDSWLITKMGLWHQTHMNQRSCQWQVLLIISRRQVIKRHRVSMSQSRTVSAGPRPFLKALDWFWPRQYEVPKEYVLVESFTQKWAIWALKTLRFILSWLQSLHDLSGRPAPEIHRYYICLPEAILGDLVPILKLFLQKDSPTSDSIILPGRRPVISIFIRLDNVTFFSFFISWGQPCGEWITDLLLILSRTESGCSLGKPGGALLWGIQVESKHCRAYSFYQRNEPCYEIPKTVGSEKLLFFFPQVFI